MNEYYIHSLCTSTQLSTFHNEIWRDAAKSCSYAGMGSSTSEWKIFRNSEIFQSCECKKMDRSKKRASETSYSALLDRSWEGKNLSLKNLLKFSWWHFVCKERWRRRTEIMFENSRLNVWAWICAACTLLSLGRWSDSLSRWTCAISVTPPYVNRWIYLFAISHYSLSIVMILWALFLLFTRASFVPLKTRCFFVVDFLARCDAWSPRVTSSPSR